MRQFRHEQSAVTSAATDSIIGSKTRAALLARTLLAPDKEFYLRELARLTGFSIRSVQQQIERLVAADLLHERRDGNRRYLRANVRSPLFKPLTELLLKTEGLVSVLRAALGEEGIDFALVFGSIAAGTPTAGSDIDVLIVGDLGLQEAVRRLGAVPDKVGREVNPVVWTRAEYQRRFSEDGHFLSTVLRGPRLMILGGMDEPQALG